MAFNPLAVILKENKLTGPNYIEWKRNLDIVLTAEEHKFVLHVDCPPMPTDLSSEEEIERYKKWIKADEIARCYILASMSSVLQHQHQAMVTASDMMLNLKELFGHQDRAARQVAMRKLMTTTMVEGTPVRDHVLKMIGHLNEIEILGGMMDADTQCDIILQSLPKSFEQFRLNYNMNKLDLTLAGLLTELVSAEGLFQQNPQIHIAEKVSASKSKGGKKKKKPSGPAKKVNGPQTGVKKPKGKCFTCKQSGHWKADCPRRKKNNQEVPSNQMNA